jgi:hypothetical protein
MKEMTLPAKQKNKGRQDQPFAKVAKESPTKAGISCDKLTRFTSPGGLRGCLVHLAAPKSSHFVAKHYD